MAATGATTGATAFVTALREAKVTTVFAYPGAVALPLFDALYTSGDIQLVLARHEQGAVFAAEGWARSRGQAGVVLVTSGPGATNTVTGIADAWMDSVPLVICTAQVARERIGTDAFQESDITGITLPITKHSYLVKSADELAPTIAEAFFLATTGRQGPVLVDIPVDVATSPLSSGSVASFGTHHLSAYNPRPLPAPELVNEAAALLTRARWPVILAGGGVIAAGASEVLLQLAGQTGIPVATTLMGRGAFPEDNPLWLGMPGLFGDVSVNDALRRADVLLAVGTRLTERLAADASNLAPAARLIHIDIDPAELGKQCPAALALIADAHDALELLLQKLAATATQSGRGERTRQHSHRPVSPPHDFSDPCVLDPRYVITALDALASRRHQQGCATIRVTEVGQNQLWAAQYSRVLRPRSFLTSGGLGAMGFGLPAAIGAQLACPEALVLNISGDGSLQMNIQELATAALEQTPIKVFVLNNGGLGLVRQWQQQRYDSRLAASVFPADVPDLVQLARSYGLVGLRATDRKSFDEALACALAHTGPVVVDCRIPESLQVEMRGTQS
jgi:acetolactate synthase-1/2/3 large subunit